MSFLSRIQTSRGVHLYLSRGRDEGKDAWHYVLVNPLKVSLFLKDHETGSGIINLLHYGEVIRSGWGKNPPQTIVDEICEEYR